MKNVFRLLFLFSFIVTIKAGAKVCFVDHTPVINLGFNFKDSEFGYLPGVDKDKKTMRELFGNYGNQTNLTDSDVKSKDDILKVLRQKIADAKAQGIYKPDLFLNYAGHGLLTGSGGFAIPLPNTPRSCIKTEQMQFQGDSEQKLYRGLYSTSYMEKTRGLGRVKISDCAASRGLTRSETCKSDHFTQTVAVFDDQSTECQKYVLTSADLEEVAKDANIYGFIDSCHSGALTKAKGVNVVASAQANELAADSALSGGKLFQFTRDLIEKYSCSLSDEDFSQMNLGNVLEHLPKVHAQVETIPEVRSFRGLARQSTENLYFRDQAPAVSNELIKNPTDLNCLSLSKLPDANSCKNPLEYVHEATKKIACGSNKFVEAGEALVITSELKEPRVFKGYTKNCGRFTIGSADIINVKRLYLSSDVKPSTSVGDAKNAK